jgi:glycosyltransferase involved in cell wall biosynthesis
MQKFLWLKVSGKRSNEMKTALVITSVASMVDQFLFSNLELFQSMGYEVHVACNFEKGSSCSDERILELKNNLSQRNILYHQINFAREVTKISENIRAYQEVCKLVSEYQYDFIHCHSPIGGVVTRIACRKMRKHGTSVIYTAHGFHFFKGAPIKNWILYYPIERVCSRWTDVLITINQEDYTFAKRKMKAKKVEYIPGIGIDVERISHIDVDRTAKRSELDIPNEAILLLSVGELNKNKNHETVIRAIANMDVYYIIAGKGDLDEHLRLTIEELGLTNRVKLLGFRKDILELCKTADVFVFPSFREGLSVSVMEAMASGLPIVCSRIRGNTDLVDENGGELFDPYSVEDCARAITQLVQSNSKDKGIYNLNKVVNFSKPKVTGMIKRVVEYSTDG